VAELVAKLTGELFSSVRSVPVARDTAREPVGLVKNGSCEDSAGGVPDEYRKRGAANPIKYVSVSR
jgi:hypothetical protein